MRFAGWMTGSRNCSFPRIQSVHKYPSGAVTAGPAPCLEAVDIEFLGSMCVCGEEPVKVQEHSCGAIELQAHGQLEFPLEGQLDRVERITGKVPDFTFVDRSYRKPRHKKTHSGDSVPWQAEFPDHVWMYGFVFDCSYDNGLSDTKS